MILCFIWILTLVLVFRSFLLYKFQYWHRKGVKTWRNNALIGNWTQLKTMHHMALLQDIYDRFKTTEVLAGFYIYTKPVAVILDLDLIKLLLVKDFNKFADRSAYKNDKDLLSANLSSLEAVKWRPLRSKLTSTFTPAKVKYMFPTTKTVANRLKATFDDHLKSEQILNISDLIGRFTIDNIATCIFGMQCNSLEDPQNECRQIALKLTGTTDINIRWRLFMQTYVGVVQRIGLNVTIFPKCIEDFFLRYLKAHFMEREKLGIRHNDLVDLLIDLRNTQDEDGKPGLTHNEVAAQLFIFFLGGYETSSAVISYALYELARQPVIQERVRQEIRTSLKEHNHEFSYEASMDMPYLDQIISETIRLYPIMFFLERTATEDYRVPSTNITLDKGTTVYIPVRRIHYDPDIYEHPEEFRPERFQPSEVAKRHPQSFLGFGDGPRNCIGLRLGRLQVIVALVSLLSNYRLTVCEKTVESFEISKHSFSLRTLNDIWLRVDKLADI